VGERKGRRGGLGLGVVSCGMSRWERRLGRRYDKVGTD